MCREFANIFFPCWWRRCRTLKGSETCCLLEVDGAWVRRSEGWQGREIWKKCSSDVCMFVFPKLVWKDLHPGNYSLLEMKRGWDSMPMKGITALGKKAWEKFLILPTMWGPNHKIRMRKQKTDLSRHSSLIATQMDQERIFGKKNQKWLLHKNYEKKTVVKPNLKLHSR